MSQKKKIKRETRGQKYCSIVEQLLSMHKALGSISSPKLEAARRIIQPKKLTGVWAGEQASQW